MRNTIQKFGLIALTLFFAANFSYAAIINVPDDYGTIQDGIDNANPGDTVLVQPDTYNELPRVDKNLTLAGRFLISGDPDDIANTIIDAGGNGTVVGLGYNLDTQFTGFTVQNGERGIAMERGRHLLTHLIVQENHNNNLYGGGINIRNYIYVTITDCILQNNSARDGGGISIEGGTSHVTVERTEIRNNEARYGGGIRNLSSINLTLTDVLIVDNVSTYIGGGINNWASAITINMTNVTLYNNAAPANPSNGGGIRMRLANELNIENCLFGGNFPSDLALHSSGNTVNVAYSNFEDGQYANNYVNDPDDVVWDDSNISEDALLEDPDNEDYHLTQNSPCIDAGDPNSPQDLDGTRNDIGFYYFHQNLQPEIELTSPNGGETFDISELATIEWDAQAGAGFDHTVVYFSSDNGDTWTEIGDVEGAVFTFDWRVPVIVGDECLIKVELHDDDENVVEDVSDAAFAIQGLTMTQSIEAGWSLISVQLIQDDMSKEAVIGDDIDVLYVLYGFAPDRGHYIAEELELGKGYFLGATGDLDLDITGVPYEEESTSFNLVRGWNMLSSPFRMETDLSICDVVIAVDGQETEYSYDDAVDEEIMLPIMYNFYDNEPEGEPDWPQGNQYQEHEAFHTFRGYWFMCLEDSVELIVNRPMAYPNPGRDEIDAADANPDHWHLDLFGEFNDAADYCRLGAVEAAGNGFDNRYDWPEPPATPRESYMRLYFERDEWRSPAGNVFNRDIQSPMQRGETREWSFIVETSQAGEVILTWNDIAETTPWMNEFTLIDQETDAEIDLKWDYLYIFECEGRREFTVRVHSSLSADQPETLTPKDFRIIAAYPNPFNAATTINYTLSQTGMINLSVFDLAGRNVQNLVNGNMPSGFHRTSFDARNLETGVYILRLTGFDQVSARKVMLVK